MQTYVLLNVAGIAALSLLCACGPFSEKKEKEEAKQEQTESKKEALAEIPADVAQTAEGATKVAMNGEEPNPEEPGCEYPAPSEEESKA